MTRFNLTGGDHVGIRRKAALAVAALFAAAAAVVAIAIGPLGRDEAVSNGEAAASDPPDAPVRGCLQRVEGIARVTRRRQRDTIIGPMAFIGLPVIYRDFAARADEELEPDALVGMPVMKSIAWVRSDARVTVVVPKSQRAWSRLVYERPPRGGLHALTFRACPKSRSRPGRPYTEFNGGVGIDFAKAPDRGRCAEVIVWVEGRKEPFRKRLFGGAAEGCGKG